MQFDFTACNLVWLHAVKSSMTAALARLILFDTIPIRRLNIQQMVYEEIITLSIAVDAAVGMACAGNDQQIEILIGFD